MLKIIKKWSWLTALVLLAVCLASGIAVAPIQADAPPSIPHNFYGYAYINGTPAAVGKAIVAKIGGVQCGSTTVVSATGYNYTMPVSSSTGGTVVFYVDGVQASETCPYSSGTYTNLDLHTYTTVLGVTTGSASSITSNSATLGGTLTGLGPSPTVYVYFEYGLTTAYGSTTAQQPLSAAVGFSAPISGLTASTTYHFRANVFDGATTVHGLDAQFTTTTPVLTVTTGSATGITTATATLLGMLSDMGPFSSVNVSFNYGPTQSLGSTTSIQVKNTTGAFSATISGLSAGTTYYFQAQGVGGSTTAPGTIVSFTTSSTSSGCTSSCCHWFWGTAYIDSSPVSGGTVAGLVNGVASGASTTTNTGGGYNFYVPVTGGSTVTFTINGVTAVESATASCMGYNGNYNLHATVGGPLTISTTSLPSGSVGSAYNATISATGGTTPYTWSLLSGTLPAGLSLSTGGVISGTPSAIATSNFTVRVTDAVPAINDKALSITIYAAGSVTITTTSLPNGTVSVAYNATLAATGGTMPYTWSLLSGSLPTGLSLSTGGVISGTPSAQGTSNFTVRVTDAVMAINDKALSITVGTTPTPPLGNKLVGADNGVSLGAFGGNYIVLTRFQADQSGNMVTFSLKAKYQYNGNVKVAIYADNSGEPGALLNAVNTSTPVSGYVDLQQGITGWNNITFPSTSITAGTYYWLAFVSDTNVVDAKAGSATARYGGFDFNSSFPNPAGSGYQGQDYVGFPVALIAGYQ